MCEVERRVLGWLQGRQHGAERVHKATTEKCQSKAEANQTIQPQPAATSRRAKHEQPVDCERLKRMELIRSEVVEVRSSERSSGEMSEVACRTE